MNVLPVILSTGSICSMLTSRHLCAQVRNVKLGDYHVCRFTPSGRYLVRRLLGCQGSRRNCSLQWVARRVVAAVATCRSCGASPFVWTAADKRQSHLIHSFSLREGVLQRAAARAAAVRLHGAAIFVRRGWRRPAAAAAGQCRGLWQPLPAAVAAAPGRRAAHAVQGRLSGESGSADWASKGLHA